MNLRSKLGISLIAVAGLTIGCEKDANIPQNKYQMWKGNTSDYNVVIEPVIHSSHELIMESETAVIDFDTLQNQRVAGPLDLYLTLKGKNDKVDPYEIYAFVSPPIDNSPKLMAHVCYHKDKYCDNLFTLENSGNISIAFDGHECGIESDSLQISKYAQSAKNLVNEAIESVYTPWHRARIEEALRQISWSTGLYELLMNKEFKKQGWTTIAVSKTGDRLVMDENGNYGWGQARGNEYVTAGASLGDQLMVDKDFNGDRKLDYLLIMDGNKNGELENPDWSVWISNSFGLFYNYGGNTLITPDDLRPDQRDEWIDNKRKASMEIVVKMAVDNFNDINFERNSLEKSSDMEI